MSSESQEVYISNNPSINISVLSSGSSLLDMLNQQSYETTDQDDSTTVKFVKNIKSCFKQTQDSESNSKDNQTVSPKSNDSSTDNDKLSTLFNTTGRERNSTGPLKQWLYEHQHHPYPKESDKHELMKKTNMSSSQITIWFTNARVKMRKENKLSLKINGKKEKKTEQDDVEEIVEISLLSDDETSESNNKRIVIAYSCLNSEQITNLRAFAGNYLDEISISDCVDNDTTHLIIGNEEEPLLCPLTMKLFQSIARHLYIISYRWVTECIKQNQIIDEMNYEIRGDIPYGEYHDGMRNSRLSKQVKLFQNCQFFILCDGCQGKMSKTELVSLIQLCHGSLLDTFPLTAVNSNSLLTIVLCNKLAPFDSSHQKQLFELSRSNGVHFLSPEWILESVVQFALQTFDFYEEQFC